MPSSPVETSDAGVAVAGPAPSSFIARRWSFVKGKSGRSIIAMAIVVAAIAILGLRTSAEGPLEEVLVITCIWMAASIAWNIPGGMGGQLSLGHAFYFAIGAYGTIILSLHGVSPWWGIPISSVGAGIIAIPFGWVMLRLRGPYFALGTLAIAQAAYQIAVWNIPVLGGDDGLSYPFVINRGQMLFGATLLPYLWISLTLVVIAWAVSWTIEQHRFGYFLRSVREDEVAASVLGVRTTYVKVSGLTVSAIITAAAGSVLGVVGGSVTPDQFLVPTVSLQLLIICYIGGIGTLMGPVIGTVLVVFVENYFTLDINSPTTSILFAAGVGVVFIGIVMAFPGGLSKMGDLSVIQKWKIRKFGSAGGSSPIPATAGATPAIDVPSTGEGNAGG